MLDASSNREGSVELNDENIQEMRYENLRSLLLKSSRYSSLLLANVRNDDEKALRVKNRKRKSQRQVLSENKTTVEKNNKRMFTKEELENASVGKHSSKDSEDNHEHLQEFDVPKSFRGELRDYQKHGMNWLLKLFLNGMNGILADEMGLGKTVQVIAHFCNLFENNVSGPHLVIAPLSTLKNWVNEIKRFAPIFNPILYHGVKSEKKHLDALISVIDKEQLNKSIFITNYDSAMRNRSTLSSFVWKYIVLDEGHRIKNSECKLLKELTYYNCQNKLLLTGTPLQNNLNELWSLLHFLMPMIFTDFETFHSWLDQNSLLKQKEETGDSEASVIEEREKDILSMVHQILTPFLLRRLKSEVDEELPEKQEVLVSVPMTELQLRYYKVISEKSILSILGNKNHEVDRIDYEKLWTQYGKNKRFTVDRYCANLSTGKEASLTASHCTSSSLSDPNEADEYAHIFRNAKLTNFMVLLKRVCNHPFLIYNPHMAGDIQWYEDYVTSCGKMILLDKMLAKLHKAGHKVLLFSQWTSILDIIEDSLAHRNYKYCRIDGSVDLTKRQSQMDEFNREGSDMFMFILTTRAGGQGINLTAADTVIIYDSDWNPQMDIQAQDRCHRIGQTRPVVVYRLAAENSIDHKIIKRAHSKRKLEQVVLKKGRFTASAGSLKKKILDIDEIREILLKQESQQIQCRQVTDKMVDDLLNREKIFEMARQQNSQNATADSSSTSGSATAQSGDEAASDNALFEIINMSDDEE